MFADVTNELKDMLILKILTYASGALAVILTVLPFLKFGLWWIRIGEFPRLQIAVLCLATANCISFYIKTVWLV